MENHLALELPIFDIISSTVGIQYRSSRVASLRPLKSSTMRRPPLGLGTAKMGLLYLLRVFWTMPSFSQARVWFLMARRCSAGSLYCGRKMGSLWRRSMVCSIPSWSPMSLLLALNTSSCSMSSLSISSTCSYGTEALTETVSLLRMSAFCSAVCGATLGAGAVEGAWRRRTSQASM